MAVNHEVASGRYFDGKDMARQLSCKGKFAGGTDGTVFGHKDRSSAGHALEYSEQAAASGELSMRGHLNGTAHPGKFSGFGDDGFVGLKDKLENGHGGAADATLHDAASLGLNHVRT